MAGTYLSAGLPFGNLARVERHKDGAKEPRAVAQDGLWCEFLDGDRMRLVPFLGPEMQLVLAVRVLSVFRGDRLGPSKGQLVLR